MSDLNVVVLSGRFIKDPEIRYTGDGMPVASIRIASSRYFRDKRRNMELKQKSLFITAETFGKLAERVHSYVRKGSSIVLKGKLILNEWRGSDGKTRQVYKIFAEDINWKKIQVSNTNFQLSAESEIDHSDIGPAEEEIVDETIPF